MKQIQVIEGKVVAPEGMKVGICFMFFFLLHSFL